MTIKHEFVRIKDEPPLTLAVSAISDYLWEDFVRDARPIVKYLENKYQIKQLCRFGKEVFDRLYTGDQVSWLVNNEECEDFIRAFNSGESPQMPQGFKPESALWWSLMGDLSNAAAWPELISICVGNQFNSGNNAVSIMNKLADEIEVIIETTDVDFSAIADMAEQLEKLREEFREAQQKGDKKAAAEARQKGKELANKIMEELSKAAAQAQTKVDEIVDSSLEECKDLNNDMNNLWGAEKGTGKKSGNLEEKKALARKLKGNSRLKAVADKLGALKKVWTERKRAKKNKDVYDSIVGAKFGNDLTKAFATELALANTAEGQALFAVKYSQKTLLIKDYETDRKDLGKGPIIMYIDASGSMRGSLELWSKAIAFVIADEALKENRGLDIHLFDTTVQTSVRLTPNRKNNAELLDFATDWSLGGGTAFNSVLAHACDEIRKNENSDVLMLTDGRSEVSDAWVTRINKAKIEKGAQWTTLCLHMDPPPVCRLFSDDTYTVNTSRPAEAVDLIQKSLR